MAGPSASLGGGPGFGAGGTQVVSPLKPVISRTMLILFVIGDVRSGRPTPRLADARLRHERGTEPQVREMTVAVPELQRDYPVARKAAI